MKKPIYVLVALVFLVNVFSVVHSVSAAGSLIPGVKAGDWAKYVLALNYRSNDPNVPSPPDPTEGVDYYRMDVLSVVASNVTRLETLRFLNGSEFSVTSWIDVSTGDWPYWLTSPMPFMRVVAGNLTAGDRIYQDDYATVLNFTETGLYAGSERQIIRAVVSTDSVSTGSHGSYNVTDTYDSAWDRLSGIPVVRMQNLTAVKDGEGYVTSVQLSVTIEETNIWAPTPAMAEVFFVPRAINLKSQGGWIMAVVELSRGVKAKDVDLSTIRINDTVLATGKAMVIGKRWLFVKFDRSQVVQFIKDNVDLQARYFTPVTLTITAQLRNGSTLQGNDKIIIIAPPSNHSRLCPD